MTRATRSAAHIGVGPVDGPVRLPARSGHVAGGPDPLLLALARYVQALDQRYPNGPEQMRSEALATGANMHVVRTKDGPDR